MPENKMKVYHKGEIISKEGAFEPWMYEIVSGVIGIYKDYGKESEKKLGTAETGFVGEMGLLDSVARSATAIAEEETELIVVDEAAFQNYFTQHPEKMSALLICMAGRMDEINRNYMSACATIRDILASEEKQIEKGNVLVKAMKSFSSIFQSRKRS